MKVLHWLDRNFELLILAIMLAVMCVLSFANVVMRYGFHHALTWSDEVCCYLLALSAFFCLPCAIRRGVSLKVDTFTRLLPESIQKYIEILITLVMMGIIWFLFQGTIELIGKADLIHQPVLHSGFQSLRCTVSCLRPCTWNGSLPSASISFFYRKSANRSRQRKRYGK